MNHFREIYFRQELVLRPITEALQDAFFGLFDGRTEDKYGGLSSVTA